MAVLKWVIMQGQGAEGGDSAECIKKLDCSYHVSRSEDCQLENLMYAESFSNNGKLCTSCYTICH